MCLRLQRDNALHLLHLIVVGLGMGGRRKEFHLGTLAERHVVLVGREYAVGVLLSGLLDHLEQAALLLFTVDDEGSAENLVTAVLAVDLCETEYLGVCQGTAQLALYLVQVFNLFCAQCQAFLLVVCLQVGNLHNGLRLYVHAEQILVQTVLVHALKHGVELGLLVLHREVFLYACNALYSHVLCYLHGIGTPGSYHLAARTHEATCQMVCFQHFGLAIQPAQLFYLGLGQNLGTFRSDDALLRCLKEGNCHIFLCL